MPEKLERKLMELTDRILMDCPGQAVVGSGSANVKWSMVGNYRLSGHGRRLYSVMVYPGGTLIRKELVGVLCDGLRQWRPCREVGSELDIEWPGTNSSIQKFWIWIGSKITEVFSEKVKGDCVMIGKRDYFEECLRHEVHS